MASDQIVWVSDVLFDPEFSRAFDSELISTDEERTIAELRKMKQGLPASPDFLPKKMWAGEYDPNIKKVPDVFSPAGYWAVSTKVADILRRFDLGQTKLFPVELFRRDGTTPIEGRHEFLNLCEKKTAFEPDLSANFRQPIKRMTDHYRMRGDGADFDLTLNKTSMSGPDLWLDTRFHRAFFLSDRLTKALEEAGFAKKMRLLKCHVVDG